MGLFSMWRSSSRGMDTPIPDSRSSIWMSLDAMSERQGSKIEGFGVKACRRETFEG